MKTIEQRMLNIHQLDDKDGMMVKCDQYPKQSNHRIYLREGKWVGTWHTARH